MNTWNERLAHALAESDYNPNRISVELKVAAPTVAAWIGAGTIKPAANITGENLLKVCRLLKIRPEWLMFKEGPMRPPSGGKLSDEMQAVIELLSTIDAIGGTEREDALYFINRVLTRDARQKRDAG